MPINSWMEIYQQISQLQMEMNNHSIVDHDALFALLNILLAMIQKELDQ